MRIITFVQCLVLGVWMSNAIAVDENSVNQAIELAKKEFENAVAAQGGWMSTKELIKNSELSAKKGDREAAIELAKKAKREAELSFQQAQNEKKNWGEPDYLK